MKASLRMITSLNRRHSIFLMALVMILLTASLTFGGRPTGKQGKHADLGIAVDMAQFRLQGGVMLEVYLLIPRANFEFVKQADGKYQARLFFQVALIQGDSVRHLDRWSRNYQVATLTDVKGTQKIPDFTSFDALPGEYSLYVEIIDLNRDVRQTIETPVNLVSFSESELTISDLELANNIVKSETENEFTKYGKDVVPNADRIFGFSSHLVYYFGEVYNLSGSGQYEVVNEISDLNGEIVRDFPPRVKDEPGTSAVEMGAVNIDGIKSGIYQLRLRVTDKNTGNEATRSKTFYIYRSGETSQVSAANEYEKLDEPQLDQIYDVANLVMSKSEKELYKSSDATGKRNVLNAFWERNNPDPSSNVNKFKRDFYDRVEMANRELGAGSKPGWQTARGQILIKYGRPNEIERAPLSTEQRPFEIWYYYDLEGGAQFVFVDRRGYGDYELVHSTSRNEISDPDWQRWLR